MTVAKYAARVGQWFSTGRTGIKSVSHIQMPDIENSKKECFSDGAGTLSKTTADQIARKLELRRTPSAFQVLSRVSLLLFTTFTWPASERYALATRSGLAATRGCCG
jgi:hypothetical protein